MYSPQEAEKEILEFWEQKKIFEKLRKKNKNGKRWSFIDGPITANNPMGVHHAWGRTYKDIFHRFRSMQGRNTRFQNGFDCQGLWVEREEEKDLGLKDKKDIERFGILKFVQACKRRVEKFSKIQTEQSKKLGQWMDWNNSYYTMSDSNNLHNWLLIKTYHDKGWLYKGKDAVPWCWRCGTASSKHDIVTEGYREVTHSALFMQFPVKGKKNEYFLIFTTTPWTVPANVAIAVNKEISYVKAEHDGKHYWIAEKRLSELKGNYKIIERKKGAALEGIEYEMPYGNFSSQKKSRHKVVAWELASEEEGTGIVHIAPGCGAEDFELGKKLHLNTISPIDESGIYSEGFGEFSGKKYSEVNKLVLGDMEKRGFAYKIVPYKHRYPHCWRCGNELVFRLVSEWYVSCKEIKKRLIEENKRIKWYPEYGKVRQEEWFKNMGDWLISRERYWGLPLPIWECECGEVFVAGSLEDLRKQAVDKKKVDNLQEIHRPWIDEIKIKCPKCGKEAERIKDVGDAWLDAGIVPFSTLNYLTDKKYWKKWFPADLISESMPGQSRGWFNALMWASVAITGKAPFKSLYGYETLKDEKGEEMHKSKGNSIPFDEAAEKIGADTMRFLYCLQDPSQEMRFGFHVANEPKNNLNIFYNLGNLVENSKETKVSKIEDKWIISRLNSLVQKMTDEMENLHPHIAARELKDFWLNDFSRGYIQFVRDRLAAEDKEAKFVVREVYLSLLELLAPFCPFITEHAWQSMRKKGIAREESVHLRNWPKSDGKKIDKKLEEEFKELFTAIESGLREREKIGIGLKWPLRELIIDIIGKNAIKDWNNLKGIISNQLNIKNVIVQQGIKETDYPSYAKINMPNGFGLLDTKMTPELEAEGYARELSRQIQAERKKAGMVKQDKIIIEIKSDDLRLLMGMLPRKFVEERINAKRASWGAIVDFDKVRNHQHKAEFKIKDKKFQVFFNKAR